MSLTINPQTSSVGSGYSCVISSTSNVQFENQSYTWAFMDPVWKISGSSGQRVIGLEDLSESRLWPALATILLDTRLFETVRGIAQAGEQTKAFVGFGGKEQVETPSNLGVSLKSRATSELIGPRRFYPDLKEIKSALSLIIRSRLTKWRPTLRLTDEQIVVSAGHVASVLQGWFIQYSSRAVANLFFTLRLSLLDALIRSATYDAEQKTVSVEFTNSGVDFINTLSAESSQGSSVALREEMISTIVFSYMYDSWNGDKFETISVGGEEYKFQLPQDDSAFSKFDEKTASGEVVISTNTTSGTFNPPNTATEDYSLRKKSLDESQIVVSGRNDSSKKEVNRLLDLPPIFEGPIGSDDCPKYENTSNPLAIAVFFGIASQAVGDTSEGLDNRLKKYVTLSDKQKKKTYSTEIVRPDVEGKLNQESSIVNIPSLKQSSLEKNLISWRMEREKVFVEWLQGAAESTEIPIWTDNETKRSFVVIANKPILDGGSVPALLDAEGFNLDFTSANKWLALQFCREDERESHLFIPVDRFKQNASITAKETTYSTCGVARLSDERYINLRLFSELIKVEKGHCVEAYIQRAETGLYENTLAGKDRATNWWLLLLLIPVVGILVYGVSRERKEGNNQTGRKSTPSLSDSVNKEVGKITL